MSARSSLRCERMRTVDAARMLARLQCVRAAAHGVLVKFPLPCVWMRRGGDLCAVRHVGYVVQGEVRVEFPDGTHQSIKAGDAYVVEAHHDSVVVGDVDYIGVDVFAAPGK